ncbi:MAG: PIN domain-containing protein [Actinobacteria bacterium]|nr:PIN domain-containing protein [Actinomycetota bacterium]
MDTSAVISMIDRGNNMHDEIKELVLKEENLCIIPSPVVTEVCQLLKYRFGGKFEINFLNEILSTSLIMELLKFEDISRIMEILSKYEDLNIGYVDSSIVAIAERLGTNKILTLNKKHFSIIIPSGFKYFDILI